MDTLQIKSGNRMVIATRNDATSPWSSRLYVNVRSGDLTATLQSAKHKTSAGVNKWAAKVLAA